MKNQKLHLPYNKFKGFLRENNLTYVDVGDLLGLSRATVGNKINGFSDFKLCEIEVMKLKYGIPNDFFMP